MTEKSELKATLSAGMPHLHGRYLVKHLQASMRTSSLVCAPVTGMINNGMRVNLGHPLLPQKRPPFKDWALWFKTTVAKWRCHSPATDQYAEEFYTPGKHSDMLVKAGTPLQLAHESTLAVVCNMSNKSSKHRFWADTHKTKLGGSRKET